MSPHRLVTSVLFLLFAACLYADKAAELRSRLPKAGNEERSDILMQLYYMSLETDDVAYQICCINDVIKEAQRQKKPDSEGEARVFKMTLLYNTDLNDSLFLQAPATLEFLRTHQSWKNYYETWSLLVNGYNFAGMTNTGLKEAKEMYDDAKERDDTYGMGMAYYSMGNVYANMYNDEEAANSYKRSISLLTAIKPAPLQLSDIFAYYCDILENQHDYETINKVTNQWKTFLDEYYAEKKSKSEAETANRWAYYYLACAQAAIGEGDYEKASEMLNEVQKRTFSTESFLYMRWLYYRAELCRLQGFYDEGIALNDRRMRMLDDTSDKTEAFRVRLQRAQLFEALGRYKEAAQLYYEMYVINDSINVHDTKRQLTEMNTLLHVDELKAKQAQEQARLEMEKACHHHLQHHRTLPRHLPLLPHPQRPPPQDCPRETGGDAQQTGGDPPGTAYRL